MVLSMALGCGCQFTGSANAARSLPRTPTDYTAQLVKHPQFPAAAAVAPDFVKAALRTITELETDVANGR